MRFLYAALVVVFLAFPAKATDNILRSISTQWMDYGGVALPATVAFNEFTRFVDLTCTTACFIAFALSGQDNIVAANQATAFYLPADTPRRFLVSGNSTVVVIQRTSNGLLIIEELSK